MSENRKNRTGVKKAEARRGRFGWEKKAETKKGFKRGAASFYIVAISTLILVIIGASFAAVIVSEVTRTSNDDLSQSAYDSALVGVEDAKVALMNYQKCLDSGRTDCSSVLNLEGGCDMVANALGREVVEKDGEKLGVLVRESNTDDNLMEQYYTCVKIATQTDNYLGFLSDQDQEHSVRIKFAPTEGVADPINAVDRVRLSWHSIAEDGDYRNGTGFVWHDPWGPNQTIPASVSLGLIQTAPAFNLSDFDYTQGSQTDRGTLYFSPKSGDSKNILRIEANQNEGFLKSNDKGQNGTNVAYRPNCDAKGEYACSVDVMIPKPVGGGTRSAETFVFSVALLYGGPSTHYSLEFFAGDRQLTLDQVQISIDSTGRANDLFRRVDTRLEPADAAYPYPIYGVEALNPGENPSIIKDFDTTCEYYFGDRTCGM